MLGVTSVVTELENHAERDDGSELSAVLDAAADAADMTAWPPGCFFLRLPQSSVNKKARWQATLAASGLGKCPLMCTHFFCWRRWALAGVAAPEAVAAVSVGAAVSAGAAVLAAAVAPARTFA